MDENEPKNLLGVRRIIDLGSWVLVRLDYQGRSQKETSTSFCQSPQTVIRLGWHGWMACQNVDVEGDVLGQGNVKMTWQQHVEITHDWNMWQ